MRTKSVSVIAMLISTLFLFSCGSADSEVQTVNTRYVKVEKVSDCQQVEKLVFNGTVRENSLTSLSFRVAGPLVKLNVDAGDYVKAGQVIAQIDERDYQLQVTATKAQFLQVKGEYARYKELHDKGKIPDNAYEKVESGYLMAKTAYDNAMNQLNDTKLIAPVSGQVHKKFVENFQTVGAGMPIVSLLDISSLEVVVSVPESQIMEVKKCDRNYLEVENAGITNLPVQTISMGNKAQKDGMFELKFALKNADSLNIVPGMSAQVTMICQANGITTAVPSAALFTHQGVNYVWVYDNTLKNITKRKVAVKRLSSGGLVELLSGVGSDEQIVTAGVHMLFEGQAVKPIEKTSATNIGGLL